MDLLASEGYLNVQRDSLELRFQVRPSTFFQRCRDQQWYINQLLKKQWHHENEIKQLKDRLRREVSKNKHHSSGSATNATSGSSITEINPPVAGTSGSSSAISVGKNCQLISVNLASTASSSTSYSSSSASETAEQPSSYSGAKSKHSGDAINKFSSKKSSTKSSKDKPSSTPSSSRYDHFYNEFDVADRPVYSNQLSDKRKDNNMPSEGSEIAIILLFCYLTGTNF